MQAKQNGASPSSRRRPVSIAGADASFAATRAAGRTAAGCASHQLDLLVVVLVLSIAISRGLLRTLSRLSVGLARFGKVTSHPHARDQPG